MRNVAITLPFNGLIVYRAAFNAARPRSCVIREVPGGISDEEVETVVWDVVEAPGGLLLKDQGSAAPGLHWTELVEQGRLQGIQIPEV